MAETTETVAAAQDAAWVQLPTDSTGKRVGHAFISEVQADGSVVTVYLPRMLVVDSDGTEIVRDGALQIDSSKLQAAVDQLTETVRELRDTLLLLNT